MNAKDTSTTPELTTLLTDLLHSAKAAEGAVNAALATVGLSMPKWSAISLLAAADEPLTLTQLAEGLTCVKSNVTQLVDRLEADRLVRRVFDPADRRVIRAELTAEGRQHYEAAQAVIAASAQQLFSGYSDEEQQLLSSLFQRLS